MFPEEFLSTAPTKEAWMQVWELMKGRTADGHLGVELVDFDAQRVVLELEISDKVRQPYGLLHGGVSLLLAESAASMHACWGLDLSRAVPVGIEVSGSHLRSASEGRIRAVGQVLRRSRSTVVHRVEVSHVHSGKLLSVVRVTNLIKQIGG